VVVDEASPLVANGFVYYVDACGYLAALNRSTGATVWHYQLSLPAALTGPLGTPTIDTATNTLIVPVWGAGGTNCPGSACVPAYGGYLAAFDATTGVLKWSSAPLQAGNMRGEPLVIGNFVFEGISGGDGDTGYVNGGMTELSLTDGSTIGTFTFSNSGPGVGDGGSSWTPISYDQASNTIYFGTGNTRANDGIFDGVIGFNPTTFTPTTFIVPTHTANIDEDVGGGELLWGGNLYFTSKSGYFFGFSLASGAPLFTAPRINTYSGQGGKGGIGTPTTDGVVMTASSGYNMGTYQSDLDCFQVGSGTPFNKIQATNSSIYSYAAFVNGVGFIGLDNQLPIGTAPGPGGPAPAFVAFDDTCKVVWQANPFDVKSFFYAGPAVTQSGVYAIDNTGNVYAWKLPYQMGMQFAVRPESRAHAGARVYLRTTRYQRIHAKPALD
jgi:outer membrane protein assembly factor BamB